jgi:hypothetical protein
LKEKTDDWERVVVKRKENSFLETGNNALKAFMRRKNFDETTHPTTIINSLIEELLEGD